jgi:uncharacterized membrane protein
LLVEAPADVAFDFWTDFPGFPGFMETIRDVRIVGDGVFEWTRQGMAGAESFEVKVTDWARGERLAWEQDGGSEPAAIVTFAGLEGNACWMVLTVEVDPVGMGLSEAEAAARCGRRIEREMRAAREAIEERYRSQTESDRRERAG